MLTYNPTRIQPKLPPVQGHGDVDARTFSPSGSSGCAAGLVVLVVAVLDELELDEGEAELDPIGEDVDDEAAEGDDPTPAALRVIMLAKRGSFAIAFQG